MIPFFFVLLLAAVLFSGSALLLELLWNFLFTGDAAIFHMPPLSFWQAGALLLLVSLVFGSRVRRKAE